MKMTNEQTLEQFLNVLNINAYLDIFEYSDMQNAINALEKQIPKKPIYEDIGNVYGALKRTCVNCGDVSMVSKCGIPFEHYCRYCGQKLNWSEEE